MQHKVTNCLWFDGNAEEAVAFYISLFKNSASGDCLYGPPDNGSGKRALVSVAFELEDLPFLALNGGSQFQFTPAISLMVLCDTAKEVDRLWNLLATGHYKVLMPLDSYPFSERYGWIADKFGLTWQLILQNNSEGQRIIPSLIFVNELYGRSAEALSFYTGVFPDSKTGTVARFNDLQPGSGDGIAHARFMLSNQWFAIMDGPGDHDFPFNEAFSFLISCETQEDVDRFWDLLSAAPAAEICGWLKDRFGVSWQVVPDALFQLLKNPDAARSQKVMERMRQMKKLDLKALEEL